MQLFFGWILSSAGSGCTLRMRDCNSSFGGSHIPDFPHPGRSGCVRASRAHPRDRAGLGRGCGGGTRRRVLGRSSEAAQGPSSHQREPDCCWRKPLRAEPGRAAGSLLRPVSCPWSVGLRRVSCATERGKADISCGAAAAFGSRFGAEELHPSCWDLLALMLSPVVLSASRVISCLSSARASRAWCAALLGWVLVSLRGRAALFWCP